MTNPIKTRKPANQQKPPEKAEKENQPKDFSFIKPGIAKNYLKDSRVSPRNQEGHDLAGGPDHVMDNPV